MTGHDEHQYRCEAHYPRGWVPCHRHNVWQDRRAYLSWRAGWREMFPKADAFRVHIRRVTAPELIHEETR